MAAFNKYGQTRDGLLPYGVFVVGRLSLTLDCTWVDSASDWFKRLKLTYDGPLSDFAVHLICATTSRTRYWSVGTAWWAWRRRSRGRGLHSSAFQLNLSSF